MIWKSKTITMRTLEKMMRDKERVDAITAEYYRDQKINDRWVYGVACSSLIIYASVCTYLEMIGLIDMSLLF